MGPGALASELAPQPAQALGAVGDLVAAGSGTPAGLLDVSEAFYAGPTTIRHCRDCSHCFWLYCNNYETKVSELSQS